MALEFRFLTDEGLVEERVRHRERQPVRLSPPARGKITAEEPATINVEHRFAGFPGRDRVAGFRLPPCQGQRERTVCSSCRAACTGAT